MGGNLASKAGRILTDWKSIRPHNVILTSSVTKTLSDRRSVCIKVGLFKSSNCRSLQCFMCDRAEGRGISAGSILIHFSMRMMCCFEVVRPAPRYILGFFWEPAYFFIQAISHWPWAFMYDWTSFPEGTFINKKFLQRESCGRTGTSIDWKIRPSVCVELALDRRANSKLLGKLIFRYSWSVKGTFLQWWI